MKKLSIAILLCLAACAKTPAPAPAPQPTPVIVATPTPLPTGGSTSTPTPAPTPVARVALSWEASHSERAPWSDALIADLTAHYAAYSKASDSASFCPGFSTLSQAQQIRVWAEMTVWDAYYESSWDPTENSPDAGTASDKDTWSVGLLQLSVVDSANGSYGFDFAQLQDPIDNLALGTQIMANQINKVGVIMIPSGGSDLYWSTLHPGGQYDKSASIISHVHSAVPYCNVSASPASHSKMKHRPLGHQPKKSAELKVRLKKK